MVMSATSFSGNGLRDWLLQRFTAVVLATYTIFLVSYLLTCSIDYQSWQGLFAHVSMKIATSLTIIALLIHAWIGVWTIAGDYIKPWCIRLIFNALVVFGLFASLIWGFYIVWSH